MSGANFGFREVAVPSSLSQPAQAYLAEHVSVSEPPAIALDDVEGWLSHFGAANANMLARCQAFADLPVWSDERQANGTRTFILRPHDVVNRMVILDFHGGGFALGSGEVCRLTGMVAAHRTCLETWVVDYRMPPVYQYPVALDDGLAVYQASSENDHLKGSSWAPGSWAEEPPPGT